MDLGFWENAWKSKKVEKSQKPKSKKVEKNRNYTNEDVDKLQEEYIKRLNEFADLSSDELIGGFDEIKGKKIRIEGYLEEFSLSRKEADDLIMAAREIVYK